MDEFRLRARSFGLVWGRESLRYIYIYIYVYTVAELGIYVRGARLKDKIGNKKLI